MARWGDFFDRQDLGPRYAWSACSPLEDVVWEMSSDTNPLPLSVWVDGVFLRDSRGSRVADVLERQVAQFFVLEGRDYVVRQKDTICGDVVTSSFVLSCRQVPDFGRQVTLSHVIDYSLGASPLSVVPFAEFWLGSVGKQDVVDALTKIYALNLSKVTDVLLDGSGTPCMVVDVPSTAVSHVDKVTFSDDGPKTVLDVHPLIMYPVRPRLLSFEGVQGAVGVLPGTSQTYRAVVSPDFRAKEAVLEWTLADGEGRPLGAGVAEFEGGGTSFVSVPGVLDAKILFKEAASVRLLVNASYKGERASTHQYVSVQPQSPMVYVPSGEFLSGKNGVRAVIDRPYFIGKHPVTVGEYKAFCDATGKQMPVDGDLALPNLPIIFVSKVDAEDYCSWLGSQTNQNIRLPTPLERERAGKKDSADARRYSWGSSVINDPGFYDLIPVGQDTRDVSPLGVCGLCGNVMDFTTNNTAMGGSYGKLYKPLYFEVKIEPELTWQDVGFRVVRES